MRGTSRTRRGARPTVARRRRGNSDGSRNGNWRRGTGAPRSRARFIPESAARERDARRLPGRRARVRRPRGPDLRRRRRRPGRRRSGGTAAAPRPASRKLILRWVTPPTDRPRRAPKNVRAHFARARPARSVFYARKRGLSLEDGRNPLRRRVCVACTLTGNKAFRGARLVFTGPLWSCLVSMLLSPESCRTAEADRARPAQKKARDAVPGPSAAAGRQRESARADRCRPIAGPSTQPQRQRREYPNRLPSVRSGSRVRLKVAASAPARCR